MPPSVPGRRDTFLDVIRAGAIVAVVGQHWLMPVLSYSDGRIATGNALATPGWALFTWLSQVMPLVFFAGGAANLISLRRAQSTRDWLSSRITRLLMPVLPLAAVWLGVPVLLRDLGVPDQPLQVAGAIAGQLLWFLAVYLVTILATPLLAVAHRRWGLAVPAVFAGLAVLVDVVRFTGFGPFGYLNALLVWPAVHQLGFHYVDGRFTRRAAVPMLVGGFGVTALLVACGPYPASMIGMPGAPVSNMSPPTAVLLSLAVGQIGLMLLLRPYLTAFAARPAAGKALSWLGSRFMSVYLWHMPALIAVAGVTVLGLGYATPEPGSLRWFAAAPGWLALAAAVLIALLRVFGRFETRRFPASAATTPQLVTAGLLGSAGLLGLAALGFTADGASLPWAALVLAGVVLAARPVTARVTG
ncbi:MAG TPA: acyltransferase [Amycolatopsis sp.]|nr:acyltransferase [Amycolatopsis sp.]